MENYHEEYIKINGIEQYFLHYPIESDIVILFLHGGPGQSEAQLSYKTIQSNRIFNVVYYDQRGTGKTQTKNKSKPSSITPDALVNDLKATIEYIRSKYPNKKIVLLGHSWGSILGMEYIKKYANTIDAYIGMGQVVNFKYGEEIAYKHCFELATEKDRKKLSKIKDYPNAVTNETVNDLCPKFRKIQAKYKLTGLRGDNSQLVKIFTKSPIFKVSDIFSMMKSMKINVNLLKYLAEYDTSGYKEFPIPVYFICGENDWQVPSVVAEEYFDGITAPDKELYRIPNAGHLTDLDNPTEYCKALNDICKRL